MDLFSLGCIIKLLCRLKLRNGQDKENKILILPLQTQLTRVIVRVTQKIPLAREHPPRSEDTATWIHTMSFLLSGLIVYAD